MFKLNYILRIYENSINWRGRLYRQPCFFGLLEARHQVTIIDDLSTGNKKLIPSNATFVECNINDTAIVGALLQKEKFDALMHFAGFVQVEESVRNPKKYFDNNTKMQKYYLIHVFKIILQILFSLQQLRFTATL